MGKRSTSSSLFSSVRDAPQGYEVGCHEVDRRTAHDQGRSRKGPRRRAPAQTGCLLEDHQRPGCHRHEGGGQDRRLLVPWTFQDQDEGEASHKSGTEADVRQNGPGESSACEEGGEGLPGRRFEEDCLKRCRSTSRLLTFSWAICGRVWASGDKPEAACERCPQPVYRILRWYMPRT